MLGIHKPIPPQWNLHSSGQRERERQRERRQPERGSMNRIQKAVLEISDMEKINHRSRIGSAGEL